MSALLKNVTNCIWHAFDSLQVNDVVHKSKLKVLTANIGTLLDLYGVEKGLDHFRSSQELTFDEFRYYLQHEVCWFVCRKNLLTRDKPVFKDESVFKLFRIFCLLADLVQDADETNRYIPSEAGIVAEQLVLCLGLRWDAADWEALGSSIGHFRWSAFLAVLEAKYCCDPQIHNAALVEAVDEIYDVFIEDIIKKGYLFKRGYLLPTMREYWCVLQPCALTYYKSSSQKEQCGRITIDEYCSVEAAVGDGKMRKGEPELADEVRVLGESRKFGKPGRGYRTKFAPDWQLKHKHRVLAEEWERREELERLQEEQNRMLEEERFKRMQFEMLQAEKEAQYREAERRLKELEQEKQKLDAELKAAQEKIYTTEHTAQALHDLNPVLRNGERARRAISFVPTTKSSSDTLIDVKVLRHLKVIDDNDNM
ncbi:unnamed protein product [Leptidea sinapis]|uniref:SWAP70 N-terminal EF-hand domain-containing protein n=1 Tax=Leptidea sinapis TaxID=189913 RepID=A0A5E4Q0S0_9NEOP|nr:unnamed protein product [Leptidea sinapis]